MAKEHTHTQYACNVAKQPKQALQWEFLYTKQTFHQDSQ